MYLKIQKQKNPPTFLAEWEEIVYLKVHTQNLIRIKQK